ncbi:MAG: hypothetical protein ACLP7P_01555 [Rhodomicrobium sp.]
MSGKYQGIWIALAVLAAAGVAVSWYFSKESNLAWWHVLGMGLTVFLLALVWLWPGPRQPKRPPL